MQVTDRSLFSSQSDQEEDDYHGAVPFESVTFEWNNCSHGESG